MTVCVAIVAKNEQRWIHPTLTAARSVADSWLVVDTGSTDETEAAAFNAMQDMPGDVVHRPWVNFGANKTEALALARERADWTLLIDADWHLNTIPSHKEWFATDPDPAVDAWMVQMYDSGQTWDLPMLFRNNQEWRFEGACHEYVPLAGKFVRKLTSLEASHMRPGGHDPERFREYLRLLEPTAHEPRSLFYIAESYRALGMTDQAIAAYRMRSVMHDGFEEERWFAAFRAAELAGDVEGLIAAWRQRPHRHEPLTAASALLADRPNDDILFKLERW